MTTHSAMTDWVGRTRRAEDLIAPFQTAGMAATLDYADPPGDGDALPPGWHWLFFADLPRQSALGPDGHERRGDFLPPIPLPRRCGRATASPSTARCASAPARGARAKSCR